MTTRPSLTARLVLLCAALLALLGWAAVVILEAAL